MSAPDGAGENYVDVSTLSIVYDPKEDEVFVVCTHSECEGASWGPLFLATVMMSGCLIGEALCHAYAYHT